MEGAANMRPEEPVSRIMTETVVVIEADRPVTEALDCFSHYPIHHLPVVRNGRLVGMLSSADVLKFRFFAPKGATEHAHALQQRFRVEQIMAPGVRSLKANACLADAVNLLIDAGAHAAAVVDDLEHVHGIVTTTDIMRCLLRGPPRRGVMPPPRTTFQPPTAETREEVVYRRKPSVSEYATALQAARTLHVEEHDPKSLGKTLLYLDQRVGYLERVLNLADRFLHAGLEEHAHSLLLQAILAAKRAEEHSAGTAKVPFPLQ